jgi:hypothetical protein
VVALSLTLGVSGAWAALILMSPVFLRWASVHHYEELGKKGLGTAVVFGLAAFFLWTPKGIWNGGLHSDDCISFREHRAVESFPSSYFPGADACENAFGWNMGGTLGQVRVDLANSKEDTVVLGPDSSLDLTPEIASLVGIGLGIAYIASERRKKPMQTTSTHQKTGSAG